MHLCQGVRNLAMLTETRLQLEDGNCLAVRQAARHVTQFY